MNCCVPLFGALLSAALLAGCDVGSADYQAALGPHLELVASYPEDGQGTDCDPADSDACGVALNVSIELRFSRYLLPSTAVRQSLAVYSGSLTNSVFLEPTYDVVERVVRFKLPEGATLQPQALYTVELYQATDEEPAGFRAFDTAPLAPGRVPLVFQFVTARAATEPSEPDQVAPSCRDFIALLGRSGCQSATCHGGTTPPMGLGLASSEDLQQTAIDRVAHQTEIGSSIGRTLENPLRFGVQMPVIDRGRPANSYLLYKLLSNPENFGPSATSGDECESAYRVDGSKGCFAPEPAEVDRMREWFVRGEPMPIVEDGADPRVTLDDLRGVQAFLRSGNCP